MSLRQHLIMLGKLYSDSEETMVAGETSEIDELSKIASDLMRSPLLSILQLKPDLKQQFWTIVNCPAGRLFDSKVSVIYTLLLIVILFKHRACSSFSKHLSQEKCLHFIS